VPDLTAPMARVILSTMGSDPVHLLTTRQAAARLDVSATTIGRWVRAGKLKPAVEVKGGPRVALRLFAPVDVQRLVRERGLRMMRQHLERVERERAEFR